MVKPVSPSWVCSNTAWFPYLWANAEHVTPTEVGVEAVVRWVALLSHRTVEKASPVLFLSSPHGSEERKLGGDPHGVLRQLVGKQFPIVYDPPKR